RGGPALLPRRGRRLRRAVRGQGRPRQALRRRHPRHGADRERRAHGPEHGPGALLEDLEARGRLPGRGADHALGRDAGLPLPVALLPQGERAPGEPLRLHGRLLPGRPRARGWLMTRVRFVPGALLALSLGLSSLASAGVTPQGSPLDGRIQTVAYAAGD